MGSNSLQVSQSVAVQRAKAEGDGGFSERLVAYVDHVQSFDFSAQFFYAGEGGVFFSSRRE